MKCSRVIQLITSILLLTVLTITISLSNQEQANAERSNSWPRPVGTPPVQVGHEIHQAHQQEHDQANAHSDDGSLSISDDGSLSIDEELIENLVHNQQHGHPGLQPIPEHPHDHFQPRPITTHRSL